MAKKGPNEKVDQAFELFKQGLKLVEIASQLNIPVGTIRSWKSRYKWDTDDSATLHKDKRNVAKKKKAIAKEVKQVLENPGLNDKQRLFCLYYVKYFNATKAYLKAYGCSYETAMVNGSELLRTTKIKGQIQTLKQNKLNQSFLNTEDIVQRYMDIAFADITDYLEFGREEVAVMGPFGPIAVKNESTGEVTELTKIVNTVKFKESSDVDGTIVSEVKQGKDGVSIKLQDRMKALDWLSKHFLMNPMDQHKVEYDKRKLEIELIKAEAEIKANEPESTVDDNNFIDALNATAKDVWSDEE